MYFADLQSYIAQLDVIGALQRVAAPVDPYLETAAIINQYFKSTGGKRALLFENVAGSNLPVSAGLFGSTQRVALALGVTEIGQLEKRLRDDLSVMIEKDAHRALAQLARKGSINFVAHADAACFEVDVTEQGLYALPALHSWPDDGGRYLTLGQVFTKHPATDQHNCGMYRIQILDKFTALIRCHPGSGGGTHMAAWHARNEAMPISIILGGPPALTWCAGAPLPDAVSEFEFTSYLSQHPVSVTRSRTNDILIPSTAEIVVEGCVLPGEERNEGPFGNHTGYYAPMAPVPVIRVKSIYTRASAVYPCTVVGPPPTENLYLGQATERLLLPFLQYDHPWVVDVHMPLEGIYHRAALVAVEGAELSMKEISQALWTSMLLRNSRLIVLLDENSDLHQASNTYWRIVNADCWQGRVLIDGERMVVDARNLSGRHRVSSDLVTLDKVTKRWREFGLGKL